MNNQTTMPESTPVVRKKSPYINFCNKIRPQIKIDHPTATFGEVGKITADMWMSFSEEEKNSYK